MSFCYSNLHYGLWIANSLIHNLAIIDAMMREIPYKIGYSLKRWRNGLHIELLKEEGNFHFDRLRTIVLREGDYNQNCKKLGHDISRAAEQYGSKRHHQAMEVTLNSKLVDDILRQTRRAGAIASNDAQNGYDSIIHSVLSICLQRMDMGKNPIQSTLTTLLVLEHYIRTAFGDSTDSYNGTALLPLQGVVQGNAVASAGWLVVSTPIINLMRDAGYGFLHWSAIENEVVRIVCFTFVDDTDLVHTAVMDATGEDIYAEMQNVLDTWEGGLKATGGALVPKKVICT
jgi:hypothetical protein